MFELDEMSITGRDDFATNPSTTMDAKSDFDSHQELDSSKTGRPKTAQSGTNRPETCKSKRRKSALYDYGQSVTLSQRQVMMHPVRMRYNARERFLDDTSLT
jgi:hypothetical protein